MIESLIKQPEQFDFFQAVRVLERSVAQGRGKVGEDNPPKDEAVRFRSLPALSFSGTDIANLKEGSTGQLEMSVAFFGLTGPQGALPEHYTRLLLERLRARDYSMRDFFNLFEHRLISLYFRAWEKHYLPAQFDPPQPRDEDRGGTPDDPLFTRSLYALTGLSANSLRRRQAIPDEVFLYYAGHFSDERRPAESLARMLTEYFGLNIRVEQFVGQWLQLDRANRSQLPSRHQDSPAHNQLGEGMVLGERVWDVQGKFRLHVGPLTRRQFEQLLPSGAALQPLLDFTRSYAGSEFDFDVQLVLRANEVPHCRLGGESDGMGARLGWNTWIGSEPPKHDVNDPVFTAPIE